MGIFDNNNLIDLLSNYLKTQFEIIKLDIQDKIEELLVRVFKYVLIALSIGMAFLFLLLGVAALLNEYLQSNYWGFFIVAGLAFFLMLILLLSIKKSQIIEPCKKILNQK
jgi:hypothetical protein